MVRKIGIDLVNCRKFSDISDKSNLLITKLFTENEINYCFESSSKSNCFSGKYAAKEAVIKLLSDQGINISHIRKIEILNNDEGEPFVNNLQFDNFKGEILISISHDSDFAIAVAILK